MNKFLFPILSAFILLIGFTASLSAQTSNETEKVKVETPIPLPPELREEETPTGGESRFMSEFINMLFVLGLIVVLLYVGSWMFRRMLAQRTMQMNVTSKVKVLEQRPLSPKSALYVIEVYGKTMLISESLNGVKFLSELPKE